MKSNTHQAQQPLLRDSTTSIDKFGLPLVINDDEINAAMKQSSFRKLQSPKKTMSNNVRSNQNFTGESKMSKFKKLSTFDQNFKLNKEKTEEITNDLSEVSSIQLNVIEQIIQGKQEIIQDSRNLDLYESSKFFNTFANGI